MRIGVECGQRWYQLHSWYCRFPFHKHSKRIFRRFPEGVVIGPIVIVRGKW